jgi:lauroyl/myristoyl acyltransferase
MTDSAPGSRRAAPAREGRPAPPLLAAADVALLARLPLMTILAWCLPPRAWWRLCRPWARLSLRLHPARSARQRRRLGALFGTNPGRDLDRLAAAVIEGHNRMLLQLLRCHRPGGWRPRVELSGGEHVRRALAAGKGAVLWITPSWSSTLVTKIAFAQEGFRVSHLSRVQHGFSASRLGMRALNPIWTSIEERHLEERLVLSAENPAAALSALVSRVRANRLVSITVAPQGRRAYAVPVLNAAVWVAQGAPVLAYRSGAALLPVFAVSTGEDAFVNVVEPALSVAAGLDRGDAVRALFAAYAAVLEKYLLRWPEQFAAMESVTLPAAPGMARPQPVSPPR